MKKILGLDLGTNSIGWAVVCSEQQQMVERIWIEMAGSRIIPMDAAQLGDFDKGNPISQTAERTRLRGIRRLRERNLLRRERLHKVLNILGFLPEHYKKEIDFDRHPGKFLTNTEPKLAWKKDEQEGWKFLFESSFQEMLADFAVHQPTLVADGKKVPYDWTIYYLRKKALSQKISKEELAWILLNFNQKRGYYQLRGEEEEEQKGKSIEFHALKVVNVEATDEKKGKETWYNVHLENGWIYRRTSQVPLNWEGQIKEFVVTTDINTNGTPKLNKEGEIKRSFRMPKEDDWTLIKTRTEAEVSASQKTVGTYIYDTLLQRPNQKIKGKLVRVIERKYYKDELVQILKKQSLFHPELQNKELYKQCIEALYPSNEDYRNNIAQRDFVYLLAEDILFYQRPLKSKSSSIADCPYEYHHYIDKETGETKQAPLKCIAKSHPLFQEFRLWQFISNLRIYQRGDITDTDVTTHFLHDEKDYATLFNWLNNRKNIDQKNLLKYPSFGLKKEIANYRWNYVEDKSYPCNETRNTILTYLQEADIPESFLTREMEESLWHILYSVEDKSEFDKAIGSFATKHGLDENFVQAFRKFPKFEKEYGSYSAKAIKKLLPLMRAGKYWSETDIHPKTQARIEHILTGEYDETISNRVREKSIQLTDLSSFKMLPLWLACYIVYDRHSEAKEITKWETPEEIDRYLKTFKQHSLRNPIVEQVIMETLRVVRDIWKKAGHIDEIHIELGREMKNPAEKRKQMSLRNLENENTNLRIKALLMEFLNPEYEIENVRPYSPSQQELLKIYEEGVMTCVDSLPEEIESILKKFRESKSPTKSEFTRYKLWLEQNYRSPYTGKTIPLGKLFTSAYEIEHIIPQSRYFDDSLSNKVICESAVNKLKDNLLGYEFIKRHHGEKVEVGFGEVVEVFSVEAYEKFVKEHYAKSKGKLHKLLMDDIPDKFIERQLNDSRYISKVIKGLLSNIVREKNENGEYESEAISKNIVVCTGSVTDRLKKDWGLHDVWNSIVYPRFERLNKLTDSQEYGHWENKDGKKVFQTEIPLRHQRGFSKKRIDHRHHAMDAIVIACATRNHISYLGNESASKNAKFSRYDLQKLLCDKHKTDENGNYKWMVKRPWNTFTQDVRNILSLIIVSFKQNLRVINKTTNYYETFVGEGEERPHKKLTPQIKGESWAIRKPMHKDTVFGSINLRKVKEVKLSIALDTPAMIVDKKIKQKVFELQGYKEYDKKRIERYFKDNIDFWKGINLNKIAIYYFTNSSEPLVAVRKPLDTSFNEKKIKESVTDSGIQTILLNHLQANGGNSDLAFSPEGIEDMNRCLHTLNGGKPHQPIYKVRVYEPKGNKFAVGTQGNKSSKYVEAAKGTNLFFAIYLTEEGKRTYETIPLNIAIEREKQGLKPVPENNEKGDKLLFWLSPNDLVYLPTAEEIEFKRINEPIARNRIYKMVSCTGNEAHFVPIYIANPIIQTIELGSNNKAQRAWSGEMIKEICISIKVDRLGNITEIKKL